MKPPPAFDAYAAEYDRHFTGSAIGRAQRKQVWRALLPLLRGRTDILEINCGTGEDAIRMAKMGHEVLATDLSGEMIRVAEAKKAEVSALRGLLFQRAGFHELPMAAGNRRFGMAFSNFGGLNCISPEENRQMAPALHRLLMPGGLLFLVFMSRNCWWEQLYFTLKGEPEKAFRRRSREPLQVSIGAREQKVWYYGPEEARELYAPWFRKKSLHPIGLFTPPSYVEPLFSGHPKWLAVLEKLDILSGFPCLAGRADHFAIILKKND